MDLDKRIALYELVRLGLRLTSDELAVVNAIMGDLSSEGLEIETPESTALLLQWRNSLFLLDELD